MNISYEMMSVIIAICFIIVIVIILLYIIMKEKESSKKIIQLEHSIEDINKEIYKIQKWIIESEKPKDSTRHNELLKLITEQKTDINTLQHGLQSDRDYFEDKILILEERLRSLGHFNAPTQQRNEKQILDMFKNGYTIEAIAKDLRMSRGEIEFVLKLSELHKERL
ncbi:hypothetical protein CQA66_01470 [Helicobacter aurati]|uniref:Helix-turn-helix domain-containing protein n=2 Tax=Helicobacter aurati TaxID=137778 RepID=A0A3D8J9E2_9HELI|nr:hypothetical protein CQA66_01470 [Helicobacter aurati]